MKFWDATTGKALAVLPRDSEVSFIIFNRDGKTLATATRNGSVKVWNVSKVLKQP